MGRYSSLIFFLLVQYAASMDFMTQIRERYQTKINGEEKDANFESFVEKLDLTALLTAAKEPTQRLNFTDKCRTDLHRLRNAIVNRQQKRPDKFGDAVLNTLIDASGRPMPGLYRGHTNFVGMVKECEAIRYEFKESSRPFRGQYARVVLSPGLKDYREGCKTAGGYLWDVCMPYSCSREDILVFFRGLVSNGDYSPVCATARLQDDSDPLDSRSYIVMGVMGGIFLLCILASLYDAFILPRRSPFADEPFLLSCFRAFSSYTIIGEILSTTSVKRPGQLPQLHCMRFFSMCWVILGHTASTFLYITWNPYDVLEIVGDFGGQLLVHSYYAVDTFFFQSGLLLSFLWFRAYNRSPKRVTSATSWLMFYVHRFLRLSPAYFMVVVFYAFIYNHVIAQLLPFFGGNPVLGNCKENFWQNFLYINNIVDLERSCYLISWYLATDMQMYIFAPLLLLPFTYSATIGVACSLIILALSTIANFITIMVYHFPPSDFGFGWKDPKMETPHVYTLLVYNAAWIRCQVYIVGFLLGYFLQKTPRLKIKKMLNLAGWVLCIGIVLAVTLPIRKWSMGKEMALGSRAIYSALCRFGWGLALSWIVISCHYGYGGPINAFLSWKGWLPLGRLTYSAYLVHIIVAIHFMGYVQAGIIFDNLFQMFWLVTAPVIILSYLAAVFWSSTFEVPFAKLESLLTGRLLGISHRAERRRASSVAPNQAAPPKEVEKLRL